jgi:pyruvate dehydrogenase E2 component (dihydrolipoamide acetyltransferase)|tara:strand:- start:208 stop:1536 length:1329 start_codon:yes stop_codon:yes gene_type:complete
MSKKLVDSIDIKIPDLGDFDSIEVIEILVKEGDNVENEASLITLETDKATMDIPSPRDGRVTTLNIKIGDKVKQGDLIGRMAVSNIPEKEIDNSHVEPSTEDKSIKIDEKELPPNQIDTHFAASVSTSIVSAGKIPNIDEKSFSSAHASPSVRKFARELGVNLIEVNGSGPKSRILHDDVKAFVKAILSGAPSSKSNLPELPTVDFGKYGDIEEKPLSRIQTISGPRIQASWINLPHVTQHDEADITAMDAERLRQRNLAKNKNIKLSPLAFIIRACALTLKSFPKVNASLSVDGKTLIYKKYCNIGFATDTENGLVVPVIKDADKKSVIEVAKELSDLSGRAREGKLSASDMQGGTFTISSLGGIGGTAFTPIINAPEVAILGVSRAAMRPIWDGKKFLPRLMLPVSFSYDHRVIDGADAARFTTHFGQEIVNVDTLIKAG